MKAHLKSILTFVAIILLNPATHAQHSTIADENKTKEMFSRFTIENGLSDNYISCIAEDKYGFLWIGTNAGLNRYDGNEFKVFRAGGLNANGLNDDKITCLFKDWQDRLWIGTSRGGLHYLDYFSDTFIHLATDAGNASRLSSNGITSIAEDADKNLWVGTNGGGLNLIDIRTGEVTYFNHDLNVPKSLDSDFVASLLVDNEGTLWIGTHNGLNRFNKKDSSFIRYNLSSVQVKTSSGSIGVIHQANTGDLWLGTAFGLVEFNSQTKKFHKWLNTKASPKTFESTRITTIINGNGGKLLLGTLADGIYNFYKDVPDGMEQWQKNNDLGDDLGSINCFYSSNEKIIWIGTSNGLHKIVESRPVFQKLSDKFGTQKLTSNSAWPIYEDKNGIMWIATIAGLNSYDPKTNKITQFTHDPNNPTSISDNSVLSIFEDSQSNLWVGTFRGGLNRLDRKTGRFIHWQFNSKDTTSLPNNLVGCIIEDHASTLWIGTAKGLAKFNRADEEFIRITMDDSQNILNHIYISDLLEASESKIWIATLRSGLLLFDRNAGVIKQWLHIPGDKNSLSNNAISDILEINEPERKLKNLLVIGTEGGGISVFDPENEKITSYSVNDGLADRKINCMVAEDNNRIWISSDNGLTMFDIKNRSFRIFDERDGIPDASFNPWAGEKSRSGLLYFGSQSGIIYFDPEELLSDIIFKGPDIVFTGLEIFNKQVKIGEDSPLKNSITETDLIELRYDENIFTITFAALDFEKPEKNLYAYKVEGFYDNWIELGTRNSVDFTGMDPGEYIFKVKAASSNGIWNNTPAKLRIVITPPFWETWWFRSLVVMIIASLLYIAYKIRLNIILREQKTRNQIARDLHDDVSATLSGITWFAKAVQGENKEQSSKKGSSYNQLIIDSAVDAQEKIKDIIWAVHPELDNVNQLFAQCQRYSADLLESKNINHQLHILPPKSSRKIEMNQRQNFWLIFKEIITNAVKHSKCTSIEIKMKLEGSNILLSVNDDGTGFDKDNVKSGNGLSNIITRAKNINAKCNLNTEPGEGTSWEIQLEIK